ncbi:MAG: hypothetical protein M3Q69_19550 [Acidobacteriota bacterium]|nr:hypothetical protein [Acidobacteriota bacterium]
MWSKRLMCAIFPLVFGACVSTSSRVPQGWLNVPAAPRIRAVAIGDDGKVSTSAEAAPRKMTDGPIRIASGGFGERLMNGPKALTDPFPSIESFSFSPSRGEVAFSAKRNGGFDIALVSSDGSPISWVPADPADEVNVSWAPRGNKISYVLRAPGGDVIRTVHIPTSATLSAPLPNATVHALAWDAAAERIAVAYSTPDTSDRVEVMTYSGTDVRTAVAPAVRLDVAMEPFGPGAMLMRPNDIRYDEKLPLVIWEANDLDWSDARAALLQHARVALVVTTRKSAGEIWSSAAALPYVDAQRAFIAGRPCTCGTAVVITSDPALEPGHYRRAGSVVTAAPAVVQSVAAGFIADQLEKGIRPTNGSSR